MPALIITVEQIDELFDALTKGLDDTLAWLSESGAAADHANENTAAAK